jgi:hypothetical protein
VSAVEFRVRREGAAPRSGSKRPSRVITTESGPAEGAAPGRRQARRLKTPGGGGESSRCSRARGCTAAVPGPVGRTSRASSLCAGQLENGLVRRPTGRLAARQPVGVAGGPPSGLVA